MVVLRALFFAIGFLTRIPVPQVLVTPRVMGLAAGFFPLVGLLLGAVVAGLFWVLHEQLGWSPQPLISIGLVGVLAVLTGGLHLDGLADVVDGLGGGRGDRERTLEIMRDSRIGSFGAVALILVLLGKVFAIEAVLKTPNGLWVLLVFPVAARYAGMLLVLLFPYARLKGLGRDFRDQCKWQDGLVATLVMACALAGVGVNFLLPTAIAVGIVLCFGLWVSRRLNGLTGDVYGAGIELAEVAFLVALT